MSIPTVSRAAAFHMIDLKSAPVFIVTTSFTFTAEKFDELSALFLPILLSYCVAT